MCGEPEHGNVCGSILGDVGYSFILSLMFEQHPLGAVCVCVCICNVFPMGIFCSVLTQPHRFISISSHARRHTCTHTIAHTASLSQPRWLFPLLAPQMQR